ncbi:MAG: cytochrome c [Parafilimonas sp.]
MKKNFLKILMPLTICVAYLLSCSKQSEDLLQPNNMVCDTSNVSYMNNVLPIISANCYSCHGNGEMEGSVSLDGYANLKIVAGSGLLEGVITYSQGFPPMPENNPKLSDCDINIISAWINNNAPDN